MRTLQPLNFAAWKWGINVQQCQNSFEGTAAVSNRRLSGPSSRHPADEGRQAQVRLGGASGRGRALTTSH